MKVKISRDYGAGIVLAFEDEFDSLLPELVTEQLNQVMNVFSLFEKNHLLAMSASHQASEPRANEQIMPILKIVKQISKDGIPEFRVFTPEGFGGAKFGIPIYPDSFKDLDRLAKLDAYMLEKGVFLYVPTKPMSVLVAMKGGKVRAALKFIDSKNDPARSSEDTVGL